MPPDIVVVQRRGPVALLTLNRPEKLNALDYPLIDRLMALLDQIEVDAGARVVVLTGAGERAFSAGADIHEFSGSVGKKRAGRGGLCRIVHRKACPQAKSLVAHAEGMANRVVGVMEP